MSTKTRVLHEDEKGEEEEEKAKTVTAPMSPIQVLTVLNVG